MPASDNHPDYGISVSLFSRTQGRYVAQGVIFDRRTMENVGGTVYGEGRVWTAAKRRAREAATLAIADIPAKARKSSKRVRLPAR